MGDDVSEGGWCETCHRLKFISPSGEWFCPQCDRSMEPSILEQAQRRGEAEMEDEELDVPTAEQVREYAQAFREATYAEGGGNFTTDVAPGHFYKPENPNNTIDVKHDLLRFSDGFNILSRPGMLIQDVIVSSQDTYLETSKYFVYVFDLHGDLIWTYELEDYESANKFHDEVFNAWVDARVVGARGK